MGCTSCAGPPQFKLPGFKLPEFKSEAQRMMMEQKMKSMSKAISIQHRRLFKNLNQEKWSYQSINKTCEIIFNIYKKQQNSIVFVFLALQIVVSYREKRTEDRLKNLEIQKMYQTKIEELSKIYPPTSKQSVQGADQIQSYTAPTLPDLFQSCNYTDTQSFYQSIRDLLEDAHKEFEPFQKYAQAVMEEKGHGSKFGEKISGNKTAKEKGFARILAKCLKSYFQIDVFRQKLNPRWDWSQYNQIFPQVVDMTIKKAIQSNKKIPFRVYDLVRCKCHYNSVADIAYTVNKFNEQAKSSGYEILKIENRLNKGTRDVALNVKAGKVVAEIQLALDFDEKGNQFNHKLYEIAREPFGVIMGCLQLISFTDIENLGATLLVTISNPSIVLIKAWILVNKRISQLMQYIPTLNGFQDIVGVKQIMGGVKDMKSRLKSGFEAVGKIF